MKTFTEQLEPRTHLSATPIDVDIWIENQTGAVAKMPYLSAQAKHGALYTNNKQLGSSSDHSLTQYLGFFFGKITDNSGKTVHDDANWPAHDFTGQPNLFSQLAIAGKTPVWFQGDKGEDKHVPARYAKDTQKYVQPISKLPTSFADLAKYDFVGISPDKYHNAHDGTLKQADDYLKNTLGWLFAGAAAHNVTIKVTTDEGQGSSTQYDSVWLGAGVKTLKSSQQFNHYDEQKTVATRLGVQPVGKATSAKFITAFGSPIDPPPTLPGDGGGDDTGPGGGGGDTLPGDGGHRRGLA